jgi:hypothetical protein
MMIKPPMVGVPFSFWPANPSSNRFTSIDFEKDNSFPVGADNNKE